MAKGGLGGGADALFKGKSFKSNGDQSSGLLATASKVQSNLPQGITVDENGTLWTDPKLLKPNPKQPRQYFDPEKLQELTESVKIEGVLEPIIIEDAGDGTFYIIAGERRTRAANNANLKKVPVQIRKYSDAQKLEIALIENIQRADLNPIEEAQAYYNLMELNNFTQEQVAERVGKKRATVANSLRLLRLPEDMQNALIQDKISSGHAKVLLSIDNETDRRIMFAKITGQNLSVRQAEDIVKEMNSKPAVSSSAAPKKDLRDPNFIDLETQFIKTLGTKVELKGSFDKGVIQISYYSREDLDGLYNKFTK